METGFIEVKGIDSKKFLQNLITQDIGLLSKLAHDRKFQGAYGVQNRNVFDIHEDSNPGATQQLPSGVEFPKKSIEKAYNGIIYSLLLSPQGRYLFDFFIYNIEENAYLIEIDINSLDSLMAKLLMYKMRSEVSIDKVNYYVYLTEEKVGFPDPRMQNFQRVLSKDPQEKNDLYLKYKYKYCLVDGQDLISNKSFPLEFGLDYLNAIDFKKGCYVGQELTTRTKFRGEIRKFIYRVESPFNLEGSSKEIMINNEEVGKITSCHKNLGIALIREINQPEFKAQIDKAEVTLTKPNWYQN